MDGHRAALKRTDVPHTLKHISLSRSPSLHHEDPLHGDSAVLVDLHELSFFVDEALRHKVRLLATGIAGRGHQRAILPEGALHEGGPVDWVDVLHLRVERETLEAVANRGRHEALSSRREKSESK